MNTESKAETKVDPELAALRARAAERAEKAAAREAAEATAVEKKKLLIEAANADAIEKATEVHGAVDVSIALVDTLDGVVIVKRPERLHWKKFASKLPKLTDEDAETLTRACLVHPTRDEYASLIEKYPALNARCGDAIATLAMGQSAESAKK